jgi:purine-nucleoside phosphorylase
MLQKVNETLAYIQQYTKLVPQYGIILGTGLGNLAHEIDIVKAFPYSELPNFPVSTVESHQGRLLIGYLNGKLVVLMQGRFHFYEGYTMQQITFPVRVMRAMGVTKLLVSNAAGSVNEHFAMGTLMVIDDHINLLPHNPLIGKNYEEWGERFPDMSEPYDLEMIKIAHDIAKENGFVLHQGVYAAVTGPNLETKAEYRYMHRIGADAVGMSTIPEVLVAVHGGMKVFAISALTDEGYPEHKVKKTSLASVIHIANQLQPQLSAIMKGIVARY